MTPNVTHTGGKDLFLKRAAELYERMTLHDQEQMITFTQIEDRALELGRQLEVLLISHCIENAGRKDQAQPAPHCPKCRQPVARSEPDVQERQLLTRSGSVSIQRSKCYCSSCRKTFFPSRRESSTRR